MKDIKANGFLELTDEELNQVSGGLADLNWGMFKNLYMENITPSDKYPELYQALSSDNRGRAEVLLISLVERGSLDVIKCYKGAIRR